jgi:hypothetical protein
MLSRLWRVVPVVAVVAVGVLGVSSSASAAPAVPPHGPEVITALYDSPKQSVSSLQKAPDQARVLAAYQIVEGAKWLLRGGHLSRPGTVVGGLDLDGYCRSIGYAHSATPYPDQEVTGGAYTWDCVSGSGAQTPINMQAACNWQYRGQVTVAYPQDPNNSWSWVCLAPASGSYTDSATGVTVLSLTTATGDATLIISPGSNYLAVDDNGNSATVVQDSDGGGYMAYDGGSCGGVLAFVGW